MYTIIVDPAYMYDFLSIYHVKKEKIGDSKSIQNFQEQGEHITKQVGLIRHIEIMTSKEYLSLKDINAELFVLVDKVKANPCLGKEVDDLVYKRYLAKQTLQKKFFGIEMKEQKVNYSS